MKKYKEHYSNPYPGQLSYRSTGNFLLIAGPCVIEGEEITFSIAHQLSKISKKYEIPLIFKASYKKANRSRLDSFTGIGDDEGMRLLAAAGKEYGIPVITDIHFPAEAEKAAQYADVLQIPAFLCRQTDLLLAAGSTGKTVNIKKGQFLSGATMQYAADKVASTGNTKIMLTERGTMLGYQDLIVDFRNIPEMQKTGYPVILDVTHALQQPNQSGGLTGGRPELIETLARAAIAAGVDGLFMETHPRPEKALSDGANMLRLDLMDPLIGRLLTIHRTVRNL